MHDAKQPAEKDACKITAGVCERHTANNPSCVMHTADYDALARALYEQQGRRNLSDGTASFYPAPWGELPEGSRDYWRDQAAELSQPLKAFKGYVIPPAETAS